VLGNDKPPRKLVKAGGPQGLNGLEGPLFRRNVRRNWPSVFSGFSNSMDSEGSSFQSGLAGVPLVHVLPRVPVTMPAGEIVAWTPPRMLRAAIAWLMEETQLPPLPASVIAPKRHA
jgi:hypothetical protein